MENLENLPLTHIYLPQPWVLYLYDKTVFKKIIKKRQSTIKPHQKLGVLQTVNDLIYLLQWMELDSNQSNKINLYSHDFILMRQGIEPIWEDPANCKGGTFTLKVDQTNGYDLWATMIMHMVGETWETDSKCINGLSISYVNNDCSFVYMKVWDRLNRSKEAFIQTMPNTLIKRIQNCATAYVANNQKRHYGRKEVVKKLTAQ